MEEGECLTERGKESYRGSMSEREKERERERERALPNSYAVRGRGG